MVVVQETVAVPDTPKKLRFVQSLLNQKVKGTCSINNDIGFPVCDIAGCPYQHPNSIVFQILWQKIRVHPKTGYCYRCSIPVMIREVCEIFSTTANCSSWYCNRQHQIIKNNESNVRDLIYKTFCKSIEK